MDTNEAKKLKKKSATGIILVMFKINYKFFLALLISTLFPWNDLKADSENTLIMLSIEPGFKIEIFVDNIDTPRQIAQSTSGNIFVGSKNGGIINAVAIHGIDQICCLSGSDIGIRFFSEKTMHH